MRKRRLELGLTQCAVAIPGAEAISNWELHHTAPAPAHLPAVIRFLGCLPIVPDAWGAHMAALRRAGGLSHVALAAMIGAAPAPSSPGSSNPTGRGTAARPHSSSGSVVARLLDGPRPSPSRAP
jgi:hypothetical protein